MVGLCGSMCGFFFVFLWWGVFSLAGGGGRIYNNIARRVEFES